MLGSQRLHLQPPSPPPSRCVLPWAEFEAVLSICHPVEPGSTALALRSTIDFTCSGHVSIFEFDIFTRLFQVREGQGLKPRLLGPGVGEVGSPDSWVLGQERLGAQTLGSWGRRGWEPRLLGLWEEGLGAWIPESWRWKGLESSMSKIFLRPMVGVSEVSVSLNPGRH